MRASQTRLFLRNRPRALRTPAAPPSTTLQPEPATRSQTRLSGLKRKRPAEAGLSSPIEPDRNQDGDDESAAAFFFLWWCFL